ncbi:MAG: cell division protein FtsQ [Alphaproteobacteria bacterium]|nr:cell division protein FtsQ [Alphaproteobacteria bacterium]
MLFTGVPVFAVILAVSWYISDNTRVENIRLKVATIRQNIENRPEFMVNLMRIDDVSAEVSEDIRVVTAVDYPISSFELDLKDMRARIEGLDAVSSAKLVVRSGGILDVIVTERLPALVWRSRDGLELLDQSGHRVSSLDTRQMRSDLPLIVGDGADNATEEALALIKAASPIAGRIRGLNRIGERRWDVVLDRNMRIMLPEENPVAALEGILALDEVDALLSRDLQAIDLRDPRRTTLRLTDNAEKNLRANPDSSTPNNTDGGSSL